MCKIDRLNASVTEATQMLSVAEDLSEKEYWKDQLARAQSKLDDYNRSVARRLTTPMALW